MGRYSRPLAVPFADFAGLPLDGRVLDVGCGPGALTAELARRSRPGRITAVDPSEEFVAALRGRHPGVEVICAPAEDLPLEGGCFDATLAQLVVNVMDDPVAGLREMARVTRDGGGVVAACVWDFTDGGPIGPFWDAAQALDPEVETGSVSPGKAGRPPGRPLSRGWNWRHRRQRRRGGRRARHVRGLVGAGAHSASPRRVRTSPASSPIGARHCANSAGRGCPEPPFVVSAKAWVARGTA